MKFEIMLLSEFCFGFFTNLLNGVNMNIKIIILFLYLISPNLIKALLNNKLNLCLLSNSYKTNKICGPMICTISEIRINYYEQTLTASYNILHIYSKLINTH